MSTEPNPLRVLGSVQRRSHVRTAPVRAAALLLFLAVLALGGGLLIFWASPTPPVQAQDDSVPTRPTGLATEPSHDSVKLSWEDPDDDSITHYQVFRRDRDIHDVGEFITIEDDAGTTVAKYTDTDVEPEKKYVYRVKAVNANGASPWSTFARADTPAAPEPTPTPTPEPNTPATGAPVISGTAQVGETLMALTTGIADADGLTNPTYSYQWMANEGSDADIPSATSASYTLVDADVGKFIKVGVSFTDDANNKESLLDPHDGGRDGVFAGIWRASGDEDLTGPFVVQCKFTKACLHSGSASLNLLFSSHPGRFHCRSDQRPEPSRRGTRWPFG